MSEPTESQRVTWYYNPDTETITGEVQGDGHGIIIAAIPVQLPSDPPAE